MCKKLISLAGRVCLIQCPLCLISMAICELDERAVCKVYEITLAKSQFPLPFIETGNEGLNFNKKL